MKLLKYFFALLLCTSLCSCEFIEGVTGNDDDEQTEQPGGSDFTGPAIEFADPRVEALCISRYDYNSDNKLQFSEAEYVSYLDSDLFVESEISTFHELQYFTALTRISEYAFQGSTISDITFPDGITEIGAHAFENCGNLTSIKLPASVTKIDDSAFARCNFRNFTLPASLTTIGSYAFGECQLLEEIRIPESVTSIGEAAFHMCDNITEFT
ncbi:MAG: leucine-rich repeat domain-containing protein, partial [Alistipes sp.]|nr:leucine-rich repeat domain-containing protein [Alistipes sp.]